MSVKDILTENQFAKIYLMVGINECGTGTPETFYERYREVVNDIRKLQPNALIFIQANLFVTQSKSDESDSINNENIAARNALIATLANQKDIFILISMRAVYVMKVHWFQIIHGIRYISKRSTIPFGKIICCNMLL